MERRHVRRDLQPPHQLLSRLRHVVLARAVAVTPQVLRLHRLALAAPEVLQLVRDETALEGVDDERFDRGAVVLGGAALALPGLVLDEEGDVAAEVEVWRGEKREEQVSNEKRRKGERRKHTSNRVAAATDDHRDLERQARVDEDRLPRKLANTNEVEEVTLEDDDLLRNVLRESQHGACRLDKLEDGVFEAEVRTGEDGKVETFGIGVLVLLVLELRDRLEEHPSQVLAHERLGGVLLVDLAVLSGAVTVRRLLRRRVEAVLEDPKRGAEVGGLRSFGGEHAMDEAGDDADEVLLHGGREVGPDVELHLNDNFAERLLVEVGTMADDTGRVGGVHPDELIPEPDDLELDVAEEFAGRDGRDEVVGVGVGGGGGGFRGEEEDATEVGVDDVGTEATKLGEELREGLAHEAVDEAVQRRVVKTRCWRADPSPEVVEHEAPVSAVRVAGLRRPRLDHRPNHVECLRRENGVAELMRCLRRSSSVVVEVVSPALVVDSSSFAALELVDERRLEDGVDGKVTDLDLETSVRIAARSTDLGVDELVRPA